MVDKRLFRVIVLGGIGLAPAALLAPGCSDDDTTTGTATDASASDAHADGFPSEGPMALDGSLHDAATSDASDAGNDAPDAPDASDAPQG
jgi:hypothetical protein